MNDIGTHTYDKNIFLKIFVEAARPFVTGIYSQIMMFSGINNVTLNLLFFLCEGNARDLSGRSRVSNIS